MKLKSIITILVASLFLSSTTALGSFKPQVSDLACLSSTIYYESVGESLAGQIAVAQTVIERKNHPSKYPKSICTVISQYQQYPWFNNTRLPIKVFEETKQIAQDVLAGKTRSKAHGATHFHSVKVKPTWAREMKHVATIGNHKFYKENNNNNGKRTR